MGTLGRACRHRKRKTALCILRCAGRDDRPHRIQRGALGGLRGAGRLRYQKSCEVPEQSQAEEDHDHHLLRRAGDRHCLHFRRDFRLGGPHLDSCLWESGGEEKQLSCQPAGMTLPVLPAPHGRHGRALPTSTSVSNA